MVKQVALFCFGMTTVCFGSNGYFSQNLKLVCAQKYYRKALAERPEVASIIAEHGFGPNWPVAVEQFYDRYEGLERSAKTLNRMAWTSTKLEFAHEIRGLSQEIVQWLNESGDREKVFSDSDSDNATTSEEVRPRSDQELQAEFVRELIAEMRPTFNAQARGIREAKKLKMLQE